MVGSVDGLPVTIAVDRQRALYRAVWRLACGVGAWGLVYLVVDDLHFRPTAVSNRLTDYSLAALMLIPAAGGLKLNYAGLKWLLLAVWPGRLYVTATADALELHLGPMGDRRFDVRRLSAVYLYEIPMDEESAVFEAAQDPEVQRQTMLPRMTHPDTALRINDLLVYVAVGTESDLARALRPFVERCRATSGDHQAASTA